jgi:outer membrane protein OmpA-like peptidoglycan-associated protein
MYTVYGMLRSFRSMFSTTMPRKAEKMSEKNEVMKFPKTPAISALLIAASLGVSAFAQSNNPPAQTDAQVQTGATASNNATGQQPLSQSKEGFWGHMNPFARKKWVNRQLDPVRGRLNELDELSAKNARDIKDVDSRAQAGIHQAQSTADQANQTAVAANQSATQANDLAIKAANHTVELNTTVSNLDQYQKVSDTEIRFRPGQTALNEKAKDALGQIAGQLQGQKGYIVEVAGYSHVRGQAGIQNSQHMADAVVRYLAEQQIPVYRIHQVAMGNADVDGSAHGSVVRVSLMTNSLAALNSSSTGGSSPTGATQ